MIGERITTRIVKARWAWSEMTSPRFGKKYPALGPDAVRLQDLAKTGSAFASLPHSDVDTLVKLIETRQSGFMPALDNVSEFVCVPWTKQDLLESITIPAMSLNKDSHILYSDFINNPPHMVNSAPEWSDPRHSVKDWPHNKPYAAMEPAIGINYNGQKMLVDGYGRSVIFMKYGKNTDHLLVWMPALWFNHLVASSTSA
jgi:hypothetical protein